jgi:hypothetical protein
MYLLQMWLEGQKTHWKDHSFVFPNGREYMIEAAAKAVENGIAAEAVLWWLRDMTSPFMFPDGREQMLALVMSVREGAKRHEPTG